MSVATVSTQVELMLIASLRSMILSFTHIKSCSTAPLVVDRLTTSSASLMLKAWLNAPASLETVRNSCASLRDDMIAELKR